MSGADMTGIILLVEDYKKILDANKRVLEARGHTVLCAETLSQARELLQTQRPDLAVLDIMLPDGDGLSFFKEMREGQDAPLGGVPVIFLTGKTEDTEILAGLEAGGNDYITKPYKIAEFCARVQTHLRWQLSKREEVPQMITRGPLSINPVARRAYLNGEDLNLQPKPFGLLLLLVQNENRAFSATELYDAVWDLQMGKDSQALRSAIYEIRSQLDGSGFCISYNRGTGYRFGRAGK